MINIYNHIAALKTTWIRRLIQDTESTWAFLFNDTIMSIKKILTLGTNFYTTFKKKCTNVFWDDVFKAWYHLSKSMQLKTKYDILSQPLWYNPLISECPIFFPKWFNSGITMVSIKIMKSLPS